MSEVPVYETPGQRVRMLRKRAGLTQAALGLQVDRTQPWVSQVERGEVELDQISVANSLARALHCHPREILGDLSLGQADGRGLESASELVRQLRRLDLPPRTSSFQPLRALAEELKLLVELRGAAAYTELGARTVLLLEELHAATLSLRERESQGAYRLLTHVCKEVHSFAYGLGHTNMIELATARAHWCADRADDPLLPALADYMSARDAWTTADWDDAQLLVQRAERTIAAAGTDPRAAAALTGALQLRGAITAARAGRKADAYARLDEAEESAQRAEGLDPYMNWFTAGNVGLHRVAVAVELGDGPEAVRRSKGLIIPKGMPPSRIAHHYLDAARAFMWVNNVEQGLAALERADAIAPQLVRHHPMAQANVRGLLRAERQSMRPRLRRMADRLHVA